eukprot:1971392-Rhodomonas_salina.2
MDRETDTQTHKTHRHTRHTDRDTEGWMQLYDVHADLQCVTVPDTHKQRDREPHRETQRQPATDRHTDRDRHTGTQSHG